MEKYQDIKSKSWGFKSRQTGGVVIEPRFNGVHDFYEGFARIRVDGKEGYIKPDGRFLIGAIFDKTRNFETGLAAISFERRCGFLRTNSTYLFEPRFDLIAEFDSDGVAFVKIGEENGAINKAGGY